MARALVKATQQDLSISRRRNGKGWSFRDGDGVVAERDTRARILALGIPPAWRDVRIAPHPRAHIQAIGVDEAGRLQYIYHADWELKRTLKKQQRLSLLTVSLPRLRRRVQQDLTAEAGSQRLALAIAVAMINRTAMRVGREKYLETNGTRGAGTLFSRDVTVNGDEVCMRFDAKGGKKASYSVSDMRLADAVSRIKALPGKRLLVYRNDAEKVVAIRTDAINQYLTQIAGVQIAAKDFRTLHASAMAGEALAKLDVASSPSARKRQIAQVAREVSEFLRNTPMICRKSYITPCLFKLFDEGKLGQLWSSGSSGKAGLKQREQRLGAVLATLG